MSPRRCFPIGAPAPLAEAQDTDAALLDLLAAVSPAAANDALANAPDEGPPRPQPAAAPRTAL